MKNYKDKAVRPEDSHRKAHDASWTCIAGCNVPGVGTWATGEKITDPMVIAKISGSPNFKPTQEVE